ncbi:MAG: rod shape-determining protein [Magnetospirillum sp. WYHS-4]
MVDAGHATERKPSSVGKTLYVGVDLGTSRTVVMSDRGHKFVVRSVVGYPRDLIGIKLLNAPYVVGEQAFEMRSYLDLHYPLEDGVLREFTERDREVARHLLGYVLKQLDAGENDNICAIIGVPARASMANKDSLLAVAQEVFDKVLVVSEPFMVAYGENRLLKSIVVDIGAGTTDFCALKGAMPGREDQATLVKAGNYVDEKLQALIVEKHPEVQMNAAVACAIKERHAFVGESAKRVEVELRAGGKPISVDVTDEVRKACESLVPEIIENIELLIQGFPPEDQADALRNILLAGGGSQISGLDAYIVKSLVGYGDAKVTRVSDPVHSGCAGALKLAQELPINYWGQLGDMVG